MWPYPYNALAGIFWAGDLSHVPAGNKENSFKLKGSRRRSMSFVVTGIAMISLLSDATKKEYVRMFENAWRLSVMEDEVQVGTETCFSENDAFRTATPERAKCSLMMIGNFGDSRMCLWYKLRKG